MAPTRQQQPPAARGRGRRLRATAVAATAAVLAVVGRPAAGFVPATPAVSSASWQRQPQPQQHSPAAAVQREPPASGAAAAAPGGRLGWRQQRQQAGFRLWSATVDRTAEAGVRVGSGGGGPADALEAMAAQFEGIYNR